MKKKNKVKVDSRSPLNIRISNLNLVSIILLLSIATGNKNARVDAIANAHRTDDSTKTKADD